MNYFEEQFLWRYIVDDMVLLDDGSVSAIIEWGGWDYSLMSEGELEGTKKQLQNFLHNIPHNYMIEFHLFRRFKSTISDIYRNHPLSRAKIFCSWFRNKMADHIASSEIHNSCFMTITQVASKTTVNPKKRLQTQENMVKTFASNVQILIRHLPQAKILSGDRLSELINYCYYKNRSSDIVDGCLANNYICQGKPILQENYLRLPDGRVVSTMLFQHYPDCDMGWITGVVKHFGEMHVCLKVKNTSDNELLKSKKSEDLSLALSSREGAEEAAVIAGEQQELRGHLAVNQLKLFKNCFSVSLYENNPKDLKKQVAELTDMFHKQGALIRSYPELQMAGWYYDLPCHGHLNRRWRVDETWQVAAMVPSQIFYCGRIEAPYMLRLGEGYQAVALGYLPGEVAHHCTLAITGAGKSLDRCTRVLECYGAGIDIYLLEIGKSAWWAIEAVGGQYHAIDPEHTAINPMPPLSAIDSAGKISQDIVSVTVDTLAFLLKPVIDNKCNLDSFERTAVQIALQECYTLDTKKAPTLVDLQKKLCGVKDDDIPQITKVARHMANYLGAFLLSVEGKQFIKNEELTIKPGACGIDLSLVRTKAPSLLKLYLVFIALKFGQLASSHKKTAEIILDETHEFVRLAPEVMKPLIEGLARMGRKEASSIDLITQEIDEIDAVGRVVVNQMIRKTLLYRTGDHEELAKRIKMPRQILDVWKEWVNPNFNDWRPGLEFDGRRWVELLLTFPKEVLALTRTDPASSTIKEIISNKVMDPITRIKQFLEQDNENTKHSN